MLARLRGVAAPTPGFEEVEEAADVDCPPLVLPPPQTFAPLAEEISELAGCATTTSFVSTTERPRGSVRATIR
jgi:hypothetical protein